MAVSAAPFIEHALEREDRAERTHRIVDQLTTDVSDDERRRLLDDLVCTNMGVARAIAARYHHRGISQDDLEQVAYLALVRVARSYDPERGHDFLSYAVPSIRGEVRRHFRDLGWMVRPPRRVQEMQSRIRSAESEVANELGRPPSIEELADSLHEPVEDVEEALTAEGCFTPTSLDQTAENESSTLGDRLGSRDDGLSAVDARVTLGPLVRRLSRRERTLLEMRFFSQRTQQEIGEEIGVSQTQVSRLINRVLTRLRHELENGVERPA